MGHSYLDINLYKQHVEDHVKREISKFLEDSDKILIVDIDKYINSINYSYNHGIKVRVVGDEITKKIILEQF